MPFATCKRRTCAVATATVVQKTNARLVESCRSTRVNVSMYRRYLSGMNLTRNTQIISWMKGTDTSKISADLRILHDAESQGLVRFVLVVLQVTHEDEGDWQHHHSADLEPSYMETYRTRQELYDRVPRVALTARAKGHIAHPADEVLSPSKSCVRWTLTPNKCMHAMIARTQFAINALTSWRNDEYTY